MNNKFSTPLYQIVVDEIVERIRKGHYRPGDKLDSIKELQKRYSIGRVTAVRVADELDKLGVVRRFRGKGTFFRGMPDQLKKEASSPEAELTRLVFMIHESLLDSKNGVIGKVFQGANERAKELSIPVRLETSEPFFLQNSDIITDINISSNEGVISYVGSRDGREISYFSMLKGIRWALVDGVSYRAQCVLTDNRLGIRLLIRHLTELGHINLLFATGFSPGICHFNINERVEAFLNETENLEIHGEIIETNFYEDIVKRMKKSKRPTAVLFAQDDPALRSIDILEKAGFKIPEDVSVCGFDDFSGSGKSLERLTTVKIKPFEMGKMAVEVLMNNGAVDNSPTWKRIAPEIVIRSSTGINKVSAKK